MSYEYWLPNANGNKEKHTTEQNAVIIVGANGSGKSKLGAWIEEQQMDSVHRIAAQRKLNFSAHLPLKNYQDGRTYIKGTHCKGLVDALNMEVIYPRIKDEVKGLEKMIKWM